MRARATDSVGAYVNSVTPGGPAAEAGIRSGDLIVSLDGQSLLAGPALGVEGQSAPGLKLVELAARLEPDDTIAVEYRRGPQRRTTRLVTGDEPVVVYGFDSLNNPLGPQGGAQLAELERRQMGMMSAPGMMYNRMPMSGGFRFSFGLADVELAPINPDLGKYFGVTQGVLVIDVPDSSTLNLSAGRRGAHRGRAPDQQPRPAAPDPAELRHRRRDPLRRHADEEADDHRRPPRRRYGIPAPRPAARPHRFPSARPLVAFCHCEAPQRPSPPTGSVIARPRKWPKQSD